MLQQRIFREKIHASFAARRCDHGPLPIRKPLLQLQELYHQLDRLQQPMSVQDQRNYLVDTFYI
jgi:hypothetical protein